MEKLREILKKYDIIAAYLFGSQCDAGLAYLQREDITFDKGSDLDIALLFRTPPENIFETYGSLFSNLSDIFEPFNVDIVFLHEVDPLFQFEVIKGNLIYSFSESDVDDFEERVIKLAADMKFKKKEFSKDFLEAIKDGYFEIKQR